MLGSEPNTYSFDDNSLPNVAEDITNFSFNYFSGSTPNDSQDFAWNDINANSNLNVDISIANLAVDPQESISAECASSVNNGGGAGTTAAMVSALADTQWELEFFYGGATVGSAEVDPIGNSTSILNTLISNNSIIASVADLVSSSDTIAMQVPILSSPNSLAETLFGTTSISTPKIVATGGLVTFDGISAQGVTFEGTTGTLKLDEAVAFTGQVSGLAGSDALDLTDISYGPNTTATFLGDAIGGTLTVTDGTDTANITLQGNYLSSTWDLSSDGSGGTIVVDPVAANDWQTLKVGAGGYITGIDIAPDDTTVIRTDTYGAYLWNGTAWQQLVTSASMPASFDSINTDSTGYSQGVYEIQIAPSNSNIMYMMYEGYVFVSSNKGTTWTQTAFSPVLEDANGPHRFDGEKMAVDPDNPNVVYVGTPENGLFVTTNGGASWQSVSSVPVGQSDGNGTSVEDYPGITGIEFDPALGVTGGKTNTIFAASYGDGIYESTNGGTSWSSIGGPNEVESAAVSSTGIYYVVSNQDSLWSYHNGAWTELLADNSGNEIQSVTIDPFNPNEIVLQAPAGYLNISYDGGATWSGDSFYSQLNAADVPWLAGADGSGSVKFMAIGAAEFDQLVPNKLWSTDGVGVWNTTLPTSNFQWDTVVTWNDQSAGIEQLVANEVIVPPGGDPVVASWDRAFFELTNLNAYPSTYGPVDGAFAAGWSLDYASSDPSFIVGLADWWGTEETGYSTNGGQTWTPFPTFLPGAGSNFIGGTIAASTPENIIWAPADNQQPYYTLDGGQTWNPITLPGVSNWSNFDLAYYLDIRTVTADRVLPNTFYLYDQGVYETTNGGVTWTEVHGQVSASNGDLQIQSVPGEAGNLFFSGGYMYGSAPVGFYQSTNQGATWTAVANVQGVTAFGFGAPAPGQSYPSIYIVGDVNNVYGIWQSNDDAHSWVQIGTYPNSSIASITTISGDPNTYGQVYVGFSGDGFAYLPAAAVGPSVTNVAASPASGIEIPGNTITFTLDLSEAVTVAGTPTLSLNDGGTATYSGGSGTSALTFSYTVSESDSNVSALAITQVNEPSGTTITDNNGNATNFAGAITTFPDLQIDPPHPQILSLTETPATGDLSTGNVVTFTLTLAEVVIVAGGTPTLSLNDGGTATYTGGSGSTALTFSYTVGTGQNTSALAVTAVNLNSASITDGAGDTADLSLSGLTQTGPQIDATTPTISSLVESPSSGDFGGGQVITLTLGMSENVTVNTTGGTPTLSLNDGGTATYSGGSGTNTLTFSYTVGVGQITPALATTAVNLNGATITNGAGNAANLSLSSLTQTGPQIDSPAPPPPTVTSVAATGAGITSGSGTVGVGEVVTLSVGLSQAVVVAGGTPTLTLNDGGTATYTGGSGTQVLNFSYKVAAGQNTAALAVTAVNLDSATVTSLPTTVTAGSGDSLTDSNGYVWSFGSPSFGGYAILRDGVQDDFAAGLTLSLDVNGVIWSENNQNNWYMVSGNSWVQEATGPITASPCRQPHGSGDDAARCVAGLYHLDAGHLLADRVTVKR